MKRSRSGRKAREGRRIRSFGLIIWGGGLRGDKGGRYWQEGWGREGEVHGEIRQGRGKEAEVVMVRV